MQKTIRSRFNHEIGDQVEGCKIVEKKVIIPPEPRERRLGVYDYVVEVPPAPAAAPKGSSRRTPAPKSTGTAPERDSYTRATPEDMNGAVIRRLPSR